MKKYLLVLLLLTGCPFDSKESDYDKSDVTPDGWHVWYLHEGSNSSWSKEEVYHEFDRRMRLINSPYAYGILYYLVDNTRFYVSQANAYATGMWDGKNIHVAIYPTQSLPPGSEYPINSLEWTRRIGTVTGTVYYAVYPPNPSFPALEHELEHASGVRH